MCGYSSSAFAKRKPNALKMLVRPIKLAMSVEAAISGASCVLTTKGCRGIATATCTAAAAGCASKVPDACVPHCAVVTFSSCEDSW